MEPGDEQGALIQQVPVCGAIVGSDPTGGDEPVEVLEGLIVPGVEHQTSVTVDDALGALVPEPAQGGALDRRGRRVQRIDFYDPAEAVGLVGLGVDVEAPMKSPPGIAPPRHPVASVIGLLRMPLHGDGFPAGIGLAVIMVRGGPSRVVFPIPREIAVNVLLGHQVGAPGGDAAGTVAEGADHPFARGVGRGPQARVAGGGSGNGYGCVQGRYAARILAVRDHPPLAVVFLDLDDGAAVTGHLDRDDFSGDAFVFVLRVVVFAQTGEHHLSARVFVVDAEQAVFRIVGAQRERDITDEVVVVAELPALCVGTLPVGIECGCVGYYRVSPTHQ